MIEVQLKILKYPCQVLSHLGWIESKYQMESNISGRFESRWSYVKVLKKHGHNIP